MCPPEDIVGGGGGHSSVISFFKRGLHSDPFQTHEMFYFFFLVESLWVLLHYKTCREAEK